MKRNFLLVLASLFFLTCKKDKRTDEPLFLGKIYQNGLLTTEYIYSSDKKPLRRNSYSTGTGQSVFAGFRLYDYSDDGLLEEVTNFSKTYQFVTKYRLQYNIDKKPVRMDDLATDNTIQYYYLYQYTAGYLSKFMLFNASTNKKTVEGYFTNDAEGKVKKVIRYSFILNNPVMYDSTTFNFSKTLPPQWSYFETLPAIALPNGDRYFFNMVCDNLFYYYVDAPPAKTNVTFSGKEYNDKGYLVKQRINYSTESFGPIVNTLQEMTYEYVK
jgi:hypothetical protein